MVSELCTGTYLCYMHRAAVMSVQADSIYNIYTNQKLRRVSDTAEQQEHH